MVGGSGTAILLGGPGGNNQISGGSGRATILGGGEGDLLSAGTGAGDVIKAASGAATIYALESTGNETIYGGSGNNLFLLGSGTTQLLTGTGAETIRAGTGTELFAFISGNRPDVLINGFDARHDFISLVGFAVGAAAAALASATVVHGSEQLLLTDGTRITFSNITGLSASSILGG